MFRYILVGAALMLAACDDQPVTLSLSGETMGTTYNITIVDQTGELDAQNVQTTVDATLMTVNALMSNWDPNSEISRFNALTSTEPVEISTDLAAVMKAAMDVHTQSEGQFDVTLGPVIELWGFGAPKPDDPVPTDIEVQSALEKTGQARLVKLGPKTMQKGRPDTSIYLAAIAKGYGVDQVAAQLRRLGVADFMVEIGGDLLAEGTNPNGDPWRIGIERPDESSRTIEEIIQVSGLGVATSGDYRNFFSKDGVRYSHIIDAVTGRPVTHQTASVTVLAENAMLADGWATAFLALGQERGMKIAETLDLAVFFIVREGTQDHIEFSTQSSARFEKLQAKE